MRGKKTILKLVVGFLLYILDLISDIYLVVEYYNHGESWWFRITLTFIVVPSIIVNILGSGHIYEIKNHEKNLISCIECILQLTIFKCYCKEFLSWIKNMNRLPCGKNYWNCTCKDCKSYLEEKKRRAISFMNLAAVRYIDAFAESAPQWCLQNYIMLRQWSFPWYTIVSTVLSLLSLAWSVTSLEKYYKIGQKTEQNTKFTFYKTSLIVFLAWQLCVLISRQSAIVMFAYVFRYYVFVVVGAHWFLMVVIACVSDGKKENLVLGTIFKLFFASYPLLFHISSPVSGQMFENIAKHNFRALMLVFHLVLLLENTIMVSLALWYDPTRRAHTDLLMKIALPLVFGGFSLGMVFLGLYYGCCHPSKMADRENDIQQHTEELKVFV